MKGISNEAKVGLLILTALVLLGGFLFVLGGVSVGDHFTLYVDFDNPGSVQPGAAVRIGGVKVGTVEEVRYLGRRVETEDGRHPLIQVRLKIDSSVQETLHEGSLLYVTSQGVLGEQFIAIDPGDPERRTLRDGEVLAGVDPPRLDLALALGYELLGYIVEGLRNNREELGGMVDDIVALIHGLRLLVTDNRGQLDSIIDNVEALSEESVTTVREARSTYINGDRPRRIMANLDRTVAVAAQEAPPLLRDARGVAHDARELMQTIGPEQRTQIQETLASASRIATSAERTTNQAGEIVAHVRQGRGTVGALLMDEEIYDDLQELIRDLKHNPWKFFWRE